ncbi:MAG: DUF3458 domain-containing protein [Planctomycetes bacterium]|nr:DUF3458 domain-containing protein [Planctomycetota bacterium]
MRLTLFLPLLFALLQEEPWTPFSDPENRHHPERASNLDVKHYRVSVTIDDQKREIEGTAEIELAFVADAERIELDAADMTFRRVALAEGDALTYRAADGKLALELGRQAKKGESLRLVIEYVAKPTHGLFFIAPDDGYPDKPWMAWTQGETEYNHHWFPCTDYPNDRATSEMIVTVREKYTTMSNGTLVDRKVKEGWRTDHWKMEVPHVAYLSSIVVGEFDLVEEVVNDSGPKVTLQYLAPKGRHTEEEIRHTFERTSAMLRFFSEKTGHAYPFTKYAQTVVLDFIWGGMENISATTLHPGTVVPKRAWMDRDSDGLIAHELAHQWFGDLVTCRSWAHIWLNEGFATYFDALWQEHVSGREALLADLEDGAGWYFQQAGEYRRPTVCEYYTYPDDVFDSYVYPRGAWVLHMLRAELGDETWWKGINHYLKRHREGCVSTDDLRVALEEVSGRDLKPFFTQWLYEVGHPEFKVTQAWDDSSKALKLTVVQTQPIRKLSYRQLSTARPLYKVPVDVEIETAQGRKTHRLQITQQEQTFTFALNSAPVIVDFDRDSNLLKSLDFPKSAAELAVQLERDDQPWHRWWAAGQLAGKEEGAAALAAALRGDTSRRVRIVAAGSLGSIPAPAAREALLEASTTEDAHVRVAVLRALGGHVQDDKAWSALVRVLAEDSSPACREAAAASMGRKGEGALKELSEAAERYGRDELIMPGVLSGLLETGQPSAMDVFLRFSAYGIHPHIRRRAADCLAENVRRQKEAGVKSEKGLARLIELVDDPDFRLRRGVIDKLAILGEPAAVPALERRIPQEFDRRVIKDIQEAIRKIKTPR